MSDDTETLIAEARTLPGHPGDGAIITGEFARAVHVAHRLADALESKSKVVSDAMRVNTRITSELNKVEADLRDSRGLRVARQVARYHIGDAEWADLIVDAYRNPERAGAALRAEMGAEDE